MIPKDSIYINPLTDFGFKYLFGRAEHKDLLLSFLNAVISDESPIVDVCFIDKEHVGEAKDDRALIYDLHCTTSTGKLIIVEMQNLYQNHFKDRALYYISSDFVRQARKGHDWDYHLIPVYGIFLMNFKWKGDSSEHLMEEICLINRRSNEIFSDKLRMFFLKIPLLNKEADACTETLDQWLYLFKNLEKMERIPISFKANPVFNQLETIAKISDLNSLERQEYDRSLKTYRDTYAIIKTERMEAKAEGRAEGRAEQAVEIALSMLKEGVDIHFIAKHSGLSIDELKRLN